MIKVLTYLAVLVLGTCVVLLESWFLMLLMGMIHLELAQVPAIGFKVSILFVMLITLVSGIWSTSTRFNKK